MLNQRELLENRITEIINIYTKPDNQLITLAIQKHEKFEQELGRCNVLVIGKTGVGKSTLVNAVFSKRLAETGTGKPITQEIFQYKQEGCPITIYDTKGLELSIRQEIELPNEIRQGELQRVKHEVSQLIDGNLNDLEERIDLIWYCVNAFSNRLEDIEEDWIQELACKRVPIILVLTQATELPDDPFLKFLSARNLPVQAIVPVLAEPQRITKDYTRPVHGLDLLVEVVASSLTEKVRLRFIQQQIANIGLKEKEAFKYVISYAGVASAAGLSPIPGSDIAIVSQLQATMIAHITSIFGLPPDRDFLETMLTTISGIGGLAVTNIAANLLKTVPGVGSLTGAAISVMVASTLTFSLGIAYAKVLKAYVDIQTHQQDISLANREKLKNLFIKEYKSYVDGQSAVALGI